MNVALVLVDSECIQLFPTWAQAAAFADAIGATPKITLGAEIDMLTAAGLSIWCPLKVLRGSDSPPKLVEDDPGSVYGSVYVGSDWLDANLGGES